MRELPVRRRAATVLLLGLTAAVLLQGCTAPQGSDEASIVPVFRPSYTPADIAAVSAACDGVGGAKAERQQGDSAMARSRPLRFDITGLDDRQQAALSACLSAQRSVQGFEQNGADDN